MLLLLLVPRSCHRASAGLLPKCQFPDAVASSLLSLALCRKVISGPHKINVFLGTFTCTSQVPSKKVNGNFLFFWVTSEAREDAKLHLPFFRALIWSSVADQGLRLQWSWAAQRVRQEHWLAGSHVHPQNEESAEDGRAELCWERSLLLCRERKPCRGTGSISRKSCKCQKKNTFRFWELPPFNPNPHLFEETARGKRCLLPVGAGVKQWRSSLKPSLLPQWGRSGGHAGCWDDQLGLLGRVGTGGSRASSWHREAWTRTHTSGPRQVSRRRCVIPDLFKLEQLRQLNAQKCLGEGGTTTKQNCYYSRSNWHKKIKNLIYI